MHAVDVVLVKFVSKPDHQLSTHVLALRSIRISKQPNGHTQHNEGKMLTTNTDLSRLQYNPKTEDPLESDFCSLVSYAAFLLSFFACPDKNAIL